MAFPTNSVRDVQKAVIEFRPGNRSIFYTHPSGSSVEIRPLRPTATHFGWHMQFSLQPCDGYGIRPMLGYQRRRNQNYFEDLETSVAETHFVDGPERLLRFTTEEKKYPSSGEFVKRCFLPKNSFLNRAIDALPHANAHFVPVRGKLSPSRYASMLLKGQIPVDGSPELGRHDREAHPVGFILAAGESWHTLMAPGYALQKSILSRRLPGRLSRAAALPIATAMETFTGILGQDLTWDKTEPALAFDLAWSSYGGDLYKKAPMVDFVKERKEQVKEDVLGRFAALQQWCKEVEPTIEWPTEPDMTGTLTLDGPDLVLSPLR